MTKLAVFAAFIGLAIAQVPDQTRSPPANLSNRAIWGNNSLFEVWRPKAHFIAPNGWLNDPMGLFQKKNGMYHVGYQAHPRHAYWGNISMGAAYSKDLVHWTDYHSWEDPLTMWPSQLYDIAGVFDGTIIPEGWNGHPTIMYTSVKQFPVGWSQAETEYTETQSLAYTTDDGNSWIKLSFPDENPVISEWPEGFNTTGFRDPFVFKSPILNKLLTNTTSTTNATGDYFVTISGGIRPDVGGRLYLYRQTSNKSWLDWTFLGPLFGTAGNASWSAWSGNYGKNYEVASVIRLNTKGRADDDGSDPDAVDFIGMGTEAGRIDHELHWPLWVAGRYQVRENGSAELVPWFSGVYDWGEVYAQISFPASGGREISAAWTYEDEEGGEHVYQRGYQGAFNSFRELFLHQTKDVDPASPGLNDRGSWGVRNESDGSTTILTMGHRVIPEALKAYKEDSTVYEIDSATISGGGSSNWTYTPFKSQPKTRSYAIKAKITFTGNANATDYPRFSVRVLASESEYTDLFYDLGAELFNVSRQYSSLIPSYNKNTDFGPLRLWHLRDGQGISTRESLDLLVIVDNSIVEVFINDHFAITSRVYPWLAASVGAGWIYEGGSSSASVRVENVELWDGLTNAWPDRPKNTALPLVWDGPLVPWSGY